MVGLLVRMYVSMLMYGVRSLDEPGLAIFHRTISRIGDDVAYRTISSIRYDVAGLVVRTAGVGCTRRGVCLCVWCASQRNRNPAL